MTPFLINEGSVWALGLAWNPEVLAAFLAWWMPLNLLSYFLLLALAKPVLGVRGFKPEVFYLRRILSSMFVTLPVMAYVAVIVVFDAFFLEPRRRKHEEMLHRNSMKDHGLEEFT